MTTTHTTATATPAEIDAHLARIWGRQQQVSAWLASSRKHLTKCHQFDRATMEASIARCEAELADLDAEAAPYEAAYMARRWNRYFLVTNSNGHVHRGMNCATCYADTQYAWLIDLADCDEAAMIAEFGEKACTVCFPSAPANPAFHAPGRRDAEAIAQRQAEKAARQAAKDAKALVAGTEFRDAHHGRVTTVAGAKTVLRDEAQYGTWYGNRDAAVAQAARVALVAKGMTDAEVDDLVAKATKKARKEMGS